MENFLNLFRVHRSLFTQTAFTLAETLIVIGILGVVAALTLPNLNHATGDKEKVTRVLKVYSALTEAFDRAEAVYGPFEEWFKDDTTPLQSSKRAGERISEFMKVSKTCGNGEGSTGCFTTGDSKIINNTDGYENYNSDQSDYKFIAGDGSSIDIYIYYQGSPSGLIVVDIDGPTKGKYALGHDLFIFDYDSDTKSFIPEGLNAAFTDLLDDLYVKGVYASAWIIRYNNADYLKLTNSTGTCQNGTVMTESNPSCN